MPNEVEIKFRITNLRALTPRLRAAGFRLLTKRTHEMNTLYDLPGEILRQRGELLRLRKYGKDWVLTHKAKGKIGKHKTRVETETKVSDGEKLFPVRANMVRLWCDAGFEVGIGNFKHVWFY